MGANPVEGEILNPLWLAFPEETRARLQQRGRVQVYQSGEVLFREGEPAAVAFFPLSGKFLLSKTGRGARRQVLCKLDPARCGGPCLLMMGEQNLGDMRALETGAVLMLARADIEELAITDPAVGRCLINGVSHCLAHFINAMGNLSFNKVAQRVALALLDSTDGAGDMVRETQAELAAEVGTTREVVARCLADMQQTGAIKLGRGRIAVLDRDLLRSMN